MFSMCAEVRTAVFLFRFQTICCLPDNLSHQSKQNESQSI